MFEIVDVFIIVTVFCENRPFAVCCPKTESKCLSSSVAEGQVYKFTKIVKSLELGCLQGDVGL